MKRFWLFFLLGIAAHAQVTYPATTTKAPQYSWAYYTKAGTNFQLGGSTPATTPAGIPQIPCQTPSGGVLTSPANCLPGLNGRAITGTTNTDTIQTTDCSPYRVTYITSVSVAVTLPTPSTLGVPKCQFKVVNGTSGSNTTVTITPQTWTISAGGGGTGSSLVINQGDEAIISTDPNNATNWVADVFPQALTAGAGITFTRSSSGLTLAVTTPLLVTSLSTAAATTDNVSITGATSSSHCTLSPTNASAATNIATTYISAKTTNQITVTHTATSGMTYDIHCTPN